MNYQEAVSLAKKGCEEGYEFLYENTYRCKFYLALQYTKNEEMAKDVIQEAYIKAFQKIDTLKQPEKFPSWIGMIVANTAKNQLAKKQDPLLFSEVEDENEDDSIMDFDIQDSRSDRQPALAFYEKEREELLITMIDTLSPEQRMCILMFYIEEASIKEISETLGCSENTVKSRLRYGKERLKVKIEELQKKGYKFYGMAPIPLFLSFFQSQQKTFIANTMNIALGKEMAKGIQESLHNLSSVQANVTAANSTARLGISKAVKSKFIHTAIGKAVTAIVSISLVSGMIYGIYQVAMPNEQSVNETSTQTINEEEYPTYIEGQLTKAELEYVFAYGPQQMDENGLSQQECQTILHTLCSASDSNGNLIPLLGTDSQGRTRYSLTDINRFFSSFADFQFSPTEELDGIQIDEDSIAIYPATVYSAKASILSTEKTDNKITIIFDYQYASQDGRSSYQIKKEAILKEQTDGYYRIVSIKEIAEDDKEDELTFAQEYTYVAPAGGNRSTMKINGDGTVQLIEGSSTSANETITNYQMRRNDQILTNDDGIAYVFSSQDDNRERCFIYYQDFDVFKEVLGYDPMTKTYDQIPEDGFEWIAVQ